MLKRKRPGWDEYFIKVAYLVSGRSTCLRRKVGAVLVKERQILATGYNGAPMGIKHCSEVTCIREKMKIPSGQRHEICRGLHAEQNVLLQAARHGISVRDSILYITNAPCSICTKMIINAGVNAVVFSESYPDIITRKMLKEAKVRLREYNKRK